MAQGFDDLKDQLEQLAVSTYMDIMSDSTADPSVRKAAADSVMKALGKHEPTKAPPTTNNLILFSPDKLKNALSGVGQLQDLLAKSVGSSGIADE